MAGPTDRTFSEPETEIMEGTYRALREYGYADLTMKHIAEECDKSTAALHYHYDTKDDLLVAFLDYILEQFVAAIQAVEVTDPAERLDILLDRLLAAPADHPELLVAMLEMRIQAPYNDAFRDRFQQNDEYVRYMLKAAINHGIDEGEFADVDAQHVTQVLMTIVDGARTRAVVFDDSQALEIARSAADEYLDAVLTVSR